MAGAPARPERVACDGVSAAVVDDGCGDAAGRRRPRDVVDVGAAVAIMVVAAVGTESASVAGVTVLVERRVRRLRDEDVSSVGEGFPSGAPSGVNESEFIVLLLGVSTCLTEV